MAQREVRIDTAPDSRIVQRVDPSTTIDALVASALRNAVRYQHAGCGPYVDWSRALHQPAQSYDPRSPDGPKIKGWVKVTFEVVTAWEEPGA